MFVQYNKRLGLTKKIPSKNRKKYNIFIDFKFFSSNHETLFNFGCFACFIWYLIKNQ